METTRLEAFSDGVIAVIITVLVLEMKVPHGPELAALAPVLPVFLSYVLSFVYVGIYWNNHHHLFQLAESVDGAVMWANLHLLFWLSLLPFSTGWMGENHFERWPTVLYGANLFACAIAFYVLEKTIILIDGRAGRVAQAVGGDLKEKISPLLYVAGIASSWFLPAWTGLAFFVVAAIIWFVPDRRMERVIRDRAAKQ
jgi:uncharacterized membrane protein